MARFFWPAVGMSFLVSVLTPGQGMSQSGTTSGRRAADTPVDRKVPEAVEMLVAILRGSEMGPGGGWFHPSQSRYGWNWLRKHYGAEESGKVTRKEFKGPTELFDRLDRNHDGVLTRADFDWTDRSSYMKEVAPSSNWFRTADKNSNGKISRAEWLEVFEKASKGKDFLSPDDLREAFPITPPSRPSGPPSSQGSSGPSQATMFRGVFSGELGSIFEGPKLGDPAPDFELGTVDGKQRIHLADYLGKKPVVLIFGSFT